MSFPSVIALNTGHRPAAGATVYYCTRKRCQLFIAAHYEPLSVGTMSAGGSNSCTSLERACIVHPLRYYLVTLDGLPTAPSMLLDKSQGKRLHRVQQCGKAAIGSRANS